jgi:hypothetical protein
MRKKINKNNGVTALLLKFSFQKKIYVSTTVKLRRWMNLNV